MRALVLVASKRLNEFFAAWCARLLLAANGEGDLDAYAEVIRRRLVVLVALRRDEEVRALGGIVTWAVVDTRGPSAGVREVFLHVGRVQSKDGAWLHGCPGRIRRIGRVTGLDLSSAI